MPESNWSQFKPIAQDLVRSEGLPESFISTVEQYYLPLSQRIASLHQTLGRPILVGVNGAQGTGKSTLAVFLEALLSQSLGCSCAKFSLDDIYLTKSQREDLAREVHPLFRTRGVPGTHDLKLGWDTIQALQGNQAGAEVAIPSFDKSVDDRRPHSQWRRYQGAAQIVLVEGWCVGAEPESDPIRLQQPINSLERDEDQDGAWRDYINRQLLAPYQEFFAKIDYLVMLKAPSMECVLDWRTLQEQKLAQKLGVHHNGAGGASVVPSGIMNEQQIIRFVQHYERLTRSMLLRLPNTAQEVFSMNSDHEITGVVLNEK